MASESGNDADASDQAPLTTLKRRALRAGGWIVAGYGLSQILRLGSSLIMTRLLAPEMFGVMAIATMVLAILYMLSDIGLRQNIVQSRRGADPVFLDTAWVLQIMRGMALWLAALLLSSALYLANLHGTIPARSVYSSPVLPFVIAASTFSAVILGFQSTRVAAAHRGLDQSRLVRIELVGQLLGLLVMFTVGVLSRSIWALVAGGIVATLATTVLTHTWLDGHRNRFRWERSALRELVHFGKWIFLSSALFVLASSGDRLLLGSYVDADVLGLYAIALLIVGAIETGLTRLFQAISLPALSEIARTEPGRLREVYYRMRVPCDLLLLFTAGLLFAAGHRVIDILYDPRYAGAGGMLEVLALSLVVVRYGVANQVYVALGLPHYQTILNAARFVALYCLVPPLFHIGGTQGAIWGIALHALASVPFVYYFNSKLKLNDIRRELMVLVALPAGWASGAACNLLLG